MRRTLALLKEARGNAVWDFIKWLYRNSPMIGAAIIAASSWLIGWFKQLSPVPLVFLTLVVGLAAYAIMLWIARRFGITAPKVEPPPPSRKPPNRSPIPNSMFGAIGRLGNLLDEGKVMSRQFSESSPSIDAVNEWWLHVVTIAELPCLEGYVRPKDVAELKSSSLDEPELLLSAEAVDRGERWVLNSERIETYHMLNVRIRHLEEFIAKINSQ